MNFGIPPQLPEIVAAIKVASVLISVSIVALIIIAIWPEKGKEPWK